MDRSLEKGKQLGGAPRRIPGMGRYGLAREVELSPKRRKGLRAKNAKKCLARANPRFGEKGVDPVALI